MEVLAVRSPKGDYPVSGMKTLEYGVHQQKSIVSSYRRSYVHSSNHAVLQVDIE